MSAECTQKQHTSEDGMLLVPVAPLCKPAPTLVLLSGTC
jgi:hypothetical protein